MPIAGASAMRGVLSTSGTGVFIYRLACSRRGVLRSQPKYHLAIALSYHQMGAALSDKLVAYVRVSTDKQGRSAGAQCFVHRKPDGKQGRLYRRRHAARDAA